MVNEAGPYNELWAQDTPELSESLLSGFEDDLRLILHLRIFNLSINNTNKQCVLEGGASALPVVIDICGVTCGQKKVRKEAGRRCGVQVKEEVDLSQTRGFEPKPVKIQ